eukprot:1959791-Alexandrium_andersonii.AAC.1
MALEGAAVAVRILAGGKPEWVHEAPGASPRDFAQAVRGTLGEGGFLEVAGGEVPPLVTPLAA